MDRRLLTLGMFTAVVAVTPIAAQQKTPPAKSAAPAHDKKGEAAKPAEHAKGEKEHAKGEKEHAKDEKEHAKGEKKEHKGEKKEHKGEKHEKGTEAKKPPR